MNETTFMINTESIIKRNKMILDRSQLARLRIALLVSVIPTRRTEDISEACLV